MNASTPEQCEQVLAFWFGPLDEHGLAAGPKAAQWWKKDPSFDARIRDEYGKIHRAVDGGSCEDWLATPRGRLAYVVVLDQFSRNLFRDKPGMFASDARALAAAKEGIARGDDRELAAHERTFLYMPLMHSESIEDQDRCVRLFEALTSDVDHTAKKSVGNNVDFAMRHRNIVARFNRFPHRNAILGRPSTPEETAFLSEPGSSF